MHKPRPGFARLSGSTDFANDIGWRRRPRSRTLLQLGGNAHPFKMAPIDREAEVARGSGGHGALGGSRIRIDSGSNVLDDPRRRTTRSTGRRFDPLSRPGDLFGGAPVQRDAV